jgi:hypothetical protein
MNAAGRVPCRCGVTLVLNPPRGGRPLSSPDLAGADIVALGYTIEVERTTGTFEAARHGLRGALGLGDGSSGVPDPARAAHPGLLWPALGLAWDPRLAAPGALTLLVALALRWVALRWVAPGSGALGPLIARAISAVGIAVAAAAATIWAASAAHEGVSQSAPLNLARALRALGRRRALLLATLRDAGLRAAGGVLALALAAIVAALAAQAAGGPVWAWRWSAPLQLALVLTALVLGFSFAHRLLAYAALAPRAAGLLAVQVELEIRRLGVERAAVPARALGPALVASSALALLLAATVWIALGAWDAIAAPLGGLDPTARAIGRDLLLAGAGGVLASYFGVTGLLAGYALGTGANREPVRAPEIITGTQSGMNAVAEDDLDAVADESTGNR